MRGAAPPVSLGRGGGRGGGCTGAGAVPGVTAGRAGCGAGGGAGEGRGRAGGLPGWAGRGVGEAEGAWPGGSLPPFGCRPPLRLLGGGNKEAAGVGMAGSCAAAILEMPSGVSFHRPPPSSA